MRKRSKSVFVGAEVQNYLQSKNQVDDDEENETKFTANPDESDAYDSCNGEDEENALDNALQLIQQVHAQIPSNDKAPYDERLEMIDWSLITCENPLSKLWEIIESERKHRLLHEVLEDAHKRSIKMLNIKRPTSYIGLYIRENRDALIAEMVKRGSRNIITTANDVFKKLGEKEKQSFLERASCAKGSYNDEMKKYSLTFKRASGGAGRERKIKMSPFVLFQQHENLKGDVPLKPEHLKKLYNDLTSDEKLTWILRYLEVKRGDKLSYEQYVNAKETLNKDEVQIIEDYEGKPKRLLPYNVFVKEFFKNSSFKNLREGLKQCAITWKAMPAEGRAKYNVQLTKAEFERKMFEYLSELPEKRRNLEIDSNSKLSRRNYEKMMKNFGNKNSTIKSKPSKKVDFSIYAENGKEEIPEWSPPKKAKVDNETASTSSKKAKKSNLFSKFEDDLDTIPEPNESNSSSSKKAKVDNETASTSSKKAKRSNLFSKFEDDLDTIPEPNESNSSSSKKAKKTKLFNKFQDEEPEESTSKTPKKSKKTKHFTKFVDDNDDEEEADRSIVFEQSPQPKKKKSFLKFSDDLNESLELARELPQPMKIKSEDEDDDSLDMSFPKPIKMEVDETNGKESKSKRAKFSDESFSNFHSKHNSTTIDQNPKKKKKKSRIDSSSECDSIPKPPKTVLKYFIQSVHKGPASKAKKAFEDLSAKELKKLNNAFKKANAEFLSDFEKRLQGMSAKELDRYARQQQAASLNEDDSD